jgi:uncharacterized protein YjiS (DUF1127 family)
MTIEFSNRTGTVAASLFRAIVGAIKAAASRRAQRIALSELLRMDPTRLDDLGINQQDVVEALNAPPPVGPRLEARRVARTTGYLKTAAV